MTLNAPPSADRLVPDAIFKIPWFDEEPPVVRQPDTLISALPVLTLSVEVVKPTDGTLEFIKTFCAVIFKLPPLVVILLLEMVSEPVFVTLALTMLTFKMPLVDATVRPVMLIERFAVRFSVAASAEFLLPTFARRVMLLPELTVRLPTVAMPTFTSPVVVLTVILPELA